MLSDEHGPVAPMSLEKSLDVRLGRFLVVPFFSQATNRTKVRIDDPHIMMHNKPIVYDVQDVRHQTDTTFKL